MITSGKGRKKAPKNKLDCKNIIVWFLTHSNDQHYDGFWSDFRVN